MDIRIATPSRQDARTETPRVFVVDDDPSVREALGVLIRSAGWQAEAFATARDFLALSRAGVPCCLVLDFSLPDIDGLDLQRRVAEQDRDMPIVFLTGYGDVQKVVRAMKAGAVDVLTKPFDSGMVLGAIADAIDLSRATMGEQAELRALRGRYASLTPREREVMALVTAGRLNKQVAAELDISEITVKAHRGKMMRKMSARSFAALVEMAARLRASPPRPLSH